ncbi:MAG: hypothetical protein CL927_19370 [Deltaproteobacteria bacterium]|nr:hypothetical protein [Deltaproteobacteria bacterium]HCH61737.1 hypothetical protein [Deltaproteobacteria bacterium]
MLAALLLMTSAFASNVDVYISGTEPDADGTCSPELMVWSETNASVFEDDGLDPNLANHRYWLATHLPEGCEVMSGLPYSEQCGPARSYIDGSAAWRVDLGTVEEGEFGTFMVVAYSEAVMLEELPIAAEVSWSCGTCALAADIDGDGAVTITDYLELLTAMNTTVRPSDPRDITGDGEVNALDLLELISSFGDECPEEL